MSRPVCFTFDDGPDEVWTPRVHAELERIGVCATFFVIGERVELHPELIRASVEAGHEVQLHCQRHVRHSELSEAEVRLDAERALEALVSAGVQPSLWRTPWGISTPASWRVARSLGLRLVGWSIDTHDWRGDAPAAMLAAAEADLANRGAVLMHDAIGPGATRGGCESTIELLGPLAQAARDRGIALAPMREAEALVLAR
jgi:peptidoglycan/xylan/chitin deacetylase (PgdA/CDA1 family)